MKPNKIFETTGLTIDELPSTISIPKSLHAYKFSVAWTRDGSALSLTSLVGSPYGKFKWQQLLTMVLTENDGEITTPFGQFAPGTKVDLIFNVFPHQNIPGAAIFITNLTTKTVKQIAPGSGQKALAKGQAWSAPVTVTLP